MHNPLVWVAIATVVMLLLEILTGRHRGVYRAGDFKLLIGSFFLGRWVMAPLAIGLIAGVYKLVLPADWGGSLADTPFWLASPALVLLGEFCFYWVHRWAHQPRLSQALWRIHRTHHSGRHMNVLLEFRLNLAWFFIIPSGWVSGLALYLGLGEAVLGYVVLLQVWNLVTHANFRWDDPLRRAAYIGPVFRALEHVLVSPGIHHTHHGFGEDGKNYRNFGTVIALYDWVFGTLHIPSGRPANYGMPGRDVHWLEELAYPLVQIPAKRDAG
ncbi:fatty acid hydroxylase family protein [Mangrovimicrobium sediminis]|uniref:Fatty acid hydroxylase family protein n=1 Tax=Mangrovimicrobium sediminis TaxID=2562682 RepID=A0A4Z0LXM6_9GAMM|nr:sterol desaturase family protein [Haliea sp. SAOS-164]TGD71908.1 fatty acid hydroxylase family protein [Haliea sp. SAOS-164]